MPLANWTWNWIVFSSKENCLFPWLMKCCQRWFHVTACSKYHRQIPNILICQIPFLVCLGCENEECWWVSDATSALLEGGHLVRPKLPVIPLFFSLTMNFAFFSMPENEVVWLFQFSVWSKSDPRGVSQRLICVNKIRPLKQHLDLCQQMWF